MACRTSPLAWAALLAMGCDHPGPSGEMPTEHCGIPSFAEAHEVLCFGGCKDPALADSPACAPCEAAPDDPLCGGTPSPTGTTGGSDSGSDSSTDSDSTTGTDSGTDSGSDSGTGTDTGGPVDLMTIQLGNNHTCATLDGRLKCWGMTGPWLGLPSETAVGDDELPSEVADVAIGGDVALLGAGDQHTCVLLDTGALRCFGDGTWGQLGYGNYDSIGSLEDPADAGDVSVGDSVASVHGGLAHTCVLTPGGEVRCWGLNSLGQLGLGHTDNIGDDELPSSVGAVDVGGTVAAVVTGNSHTCALMTGAAGAVRCWGGSNYGELGYGNFAAIGDNELPSSVGDVDVGGTVVQLVAGNNHNCALLDTGAVRCWGRNDYGQLGLGHTNNIGDDELPSSAADVDIGGNAMVIYAGGPRSCALLDTDELVCWGASNFGALGYGNLDNVGDDETPGSVGTLDLGGPVASMDIGTYHACAVLMDGGARCWGSGVRLGYGNTTDIGDDETPASAGDVSIWR